MPVPPRVGIGLAVTVRTQQLQILEAVVETVTVYVVKLEVEGPAAPATPPAVLAASGLEAGAQESQLQVVPAAVGAGNAKLRDRCSTRSRDDGPAPGCIRPAAGGKAELRPAIPNAVPFVVVELRVGWWRRIADGLAGGDVRCGS